MGQNSKFWRFYKWSKIIQGASSARAGDREALFPCFLPDPEALSAQRTFRRDRTARTFYAKRWVNTLFCWGDFLVLGCPEKEEKYERGAGFNGSPLVRRCADQLLGEIEAFSSEELRNLSLQLNGGKLELEKALYSIDGFDYSNPPPFDFEGKTSVALPVKAERIAVPSHAGRVEILDHLPPERARAVRDLI